jgi:peptidoglycan/LPS O-acetylase OafA/YrhL
MVASLSERLNSANGKPSGFDYMRLALAVLVIGFHSVVTSYGADAQAKFNQTLTGQIFGLILPMFFCLSGFLVAGRADSKVKCNTCNPVRSADAKHPKTLPATSA